MLIKNENRIIRILETQEDRVLIVNCTQKSMPMWISKAELSDFSACEEDPLPCSLPDFESLSPEQKRCAHERYTLIAGVLPFIGDERLRCDAISHISSSRGISKQTIRSYLYRYLVYQNLSALAPKSKDQEKTLTQDEKNIRWALNKFYYTRYKNSLSTDDDDDLDVMCDVMQLPSKLKEVVMLYYWQKMNVNEIAHALGVTHSTVSTRLKRAREKLHDVLERRLGYGRLQR